MKPRSNPDYEAGFTRAANHDAPTPEELLLDRAKRSRRIKLALAAVTVLAIAGGAIAAVELRRDTPAKQVARGIAFSKTNSHVAAIIEFKRALQEEPDRAEVRLLLGQELSLMSDARGAEIEFRKAADAKYQPDKTLPLLATSLLHQGKFDKVIAFVDTAQVESPDANAQLLSLRGASYFALGREAEAEASWKAANEFVPGNPSAVLALARSLASKRAYDEAGKALDGIGPDAPQVELLTLRAEIARATHKPLDAVTAYQQALQVEPGNLFVRESLAQTFVELGRFDEASDQVKRVLLPMPNNANAHFINALIAFGRKDFAAASESIGRAVQIMPIDGRYQLLAGTVAIQRGEISEARQHLRDAVTLMPNNVDARRMLALIYVDRRDAVRADEVFLPVFSTFRSDPEAARIEARIAMLQGNRAKAAHAFDDVDATNPKNADVSVLAASLRIAAGDKAGGFERLRVAAQASPQNADIDAALVKSHLTFSEIKEAQAAWNGLAQKQPDAARTYNLRAAIELARNDKTAARMSLQQAADADPRFLAPVSALALLDINDKKADDAKARLKKFVAANPHDIDAVMLSIQVEKANGNATDAISGLLRDALDANPRSGQLTYALVGYYAEHGDPKKALEVAEKGLTFAPNDLGLLQFVGDHALAVGDNDRAIALFTKLIDLDAGSADYAARLGTAQLAAGNTEETLTAFRLALSRQPDNVDRQLAMVSSLLAAGKVEEGARMLFDITRLAPRSPVIPELDADVKLGQRQYPEANAGYRRALAAKPSSRLAIKTYNGLVTARQRGEARAFLADWLKAHPTDERLRAIDADVALRAKDFARASSDYRVLLVAHPNDPLLLNNLAWSLARINDPQALAMAEKASGLAPDNPAVNDTLGWLLVEKGDADRGLKLIEKAHQAAPNELEIRLHLAKAQLKQGRNDAARATLKGLVASAPESEEGRASQALLATF